ncbi:MAG: glycosyltransferase [Thermoanaerobaculia bacterium]
MTYDVIIPAKDEAQTIGAVVHAARRAPNASRVIVIDDMSSDGTAEVAREAGAEVISSRGRGSKALALATGVAESAADILVFFDADILNPQPGHFESLAAPVAEGEFMMCCGIIDYGAMRNPFFLRLPPITGMRGLRREVFAGIPPHRLNGFQIEIMINEVVARGGMPSAIRVLTGAGHRSKIGKLGTLRGLRAHLSMTAELLHCFTFVPLWTYRSYLQNLTILPAD